MAVLLSTYHPDLRAEIPELPSFVADRYLIRAAREFLEESRAWRVNADLSTTADTATVSLVSVLPANTELVDIISVKDTLGSTPVTPTTFAKLDKERADWREETDLSAMYYVLESNNRLRFVPTPANTITAKYHVRFAVKPTLAATSLDDVVANKYDEAIISGALSRLFGQARKPWSDDRREAKHFARFQLAKSAARTEAAEEFQTGVARKVKYGGL
jgi:hypothetical protein